MANWSYFYLIRIEFLGFRYHGWQVQPKVKSVEEMINKTIPYVLGHDQFKVLGCGRTDAKVSAEDFVMELFLNEAISLETFLDTFNSNLPFDIRAKSITQTDKGFNIIQHPKIKEYHYHFSFGDKTHPFNAPYIINVEQELDIDLMKEATQLFIGTHNFRRFTSKDSQHKNLEREIMDCELASNTQFQGAFFPASSYTFKVKAKGFLRYQVRLMMASLFQLGKGEITIDQFKEYLSQPLEEPINTIAPASGLVLHKVDL